MLLLDLENILSMDFLRSLLVFDLVPIIVAAIIVLQIFFFIKNVLRMLEYKKIFEEEYSWDLIRNPQTKFVSGIKGNGNEIFDAIKDSINKYLGNSSGSVIDYSLLKDAVDRHCDSVENDINALTPVPLYCGLAGTMAGVIVGLSSLLATGSITALLSSGSGDFKAAADGVNDLLSGVAWAMLASICGILLTTIASLLFKRYKLEGESGKNTFLAWLQSKLLPELPTDTSDALSRLVKNLREFNKVFSSNTSELRNALREVNGSYRIQGDIIKAVRDMDVMQMAEANVKVLKELQQCTDKLKWFNEYLNSIHGYTDAIHTFTAQFEQEANRLHVLEEIQQFFVRHKAEIAKDSADADVTLRSALETLKESASTNIRELNTIFVQQAEEFKRIIQEEKETFETVCTEIRTQFVTQLSQSANSNMSEFNSALAQQANESRKIIQLERETFETVCNEIRTQFNTQLSQMAMLEQRFADLAEIPAKLDKLIEKMESSNNNLATQINSTISKLDLTFTQNNQKEREALQTVFSELRTQFNTQLSQMAMLEQRFADIAEIPAKLDKLIERLESSNSNLATQISSIMMQKAKELTSVSHNGETVPYTPPQVFPKWMKWTVVVSVILIALACISNTAYNIGVGQSDKQAATTKEVIKAVSDSIQVELQKKEMLSDSVQQQDSISKSKHKKQE